MTSLSWIYINFCVIMWHKYKVRLQFQHIQEVWLLYFRVKVSVYVKKAWHLKAFTRFYLELSEPHAINYWLLDSIIGDRQGMVAHISDPDTWEGEARGSGQQTNKSSWYWRSDEWFGVSIMRSANVNNCLPGAEMCLLQLTWLFMFRCS